MTVFPVATVADAASPYSIFLLPPLASLLNAHNSSLASLAALGRRFLSPASFDDFCHFTVFLHLRLLLLLLPPFSLLAADAASAASRFGPGSIF